MISGAHVVIYSKNAEADRAFLRDVIGFKSVDAVTAGSSSRCRQQKLHCIRRMRTASTNSISCATI